MDFKFSIKNARVLTARGTRTCDIQIESGRISRVGKTAENRKSDLDAHGRLVLPAFIDCHTHLFSLAMQERYVNLLGAKSISEVKDRIRAFLIREKAAFSHSSWILGRSWDQDCFPNREWPTRRDLDDVTEDYPMMMVRVCGHIAVLNSTAIHKLGGLQFAESLVPVNNDGAPTGIVKEAALDYSWSKIPNPSQAQLRRLFLKVQDRALQYGLWSVHCILSEDWRKEISVIRELDRSKKLLLRMSILLPVSAIQYVERLRSRNSESELSGKNFTTIGFKLFSDGSLGGRTAALSEPYTDDPSNTGILNYQTEQIVELAKRIKKMGMILATHAIGDRAISQVLEAYKKAGVRKKDSFRIEHGSVVNEDIMAKISNVILSVQPSFATSDYWIPQRLGDRKTRVAYPFKSLSEWSKLVGGSDAPVESLSPIDGICSALDNPVANESLSLWQAVQLYTSNSASQSPLTADSGEISSGKECNLVVLNITDEHDICRARVDCLFISGELRSFS